jgi:hypothetical protein
MLIVSIGELEISDCYCFYPLVRLQELGIALLDIAAIGINLLMLRIEVWLEAAVFLSMPTYVIPKFWNFVDCRKQEGNLSSSNRRTETCFFFCNV